MLSTGFVQLFKVKEEVDFIIALGYPDYIIPLLGALKILGVAIILIPKLPLLKEWAYAGFVFTMLGAIFSHAVVGNGIGEISPPVLLLILTLISWYFRPADRKVIANRSGNDNVSAERPLQEFKHSHG